MREAHIIQNTELHSLQALQLDDFSRFKEKVIMINTLKSLIIQTDKHLLKAIVKREGNGLTSKNLRHALETIVEHAIKRATL